MDVDDQQQSTTNEPKHHEILWFEEGNVVLATDAYLFKVHKSLLSLHSSVFKDMFSLPNVGGHNDQGVGNGENRAGAEMYEGVPLVRLAGDTGEEVAHLLRAIYEQHYYHRDNDDTPLETVVALLRLSTKYDFTHLRKDVVRQISDHYSMDFSQNSGGSSDDCLLLFGRTKQECHFALLSASYTAEVTALLPILYFACCRFSMEDTLKFGQLLPSECLTTLLKGREQLDVEQNYLITDLPDTLLEGLSIACQTGQCIAKARYIGLSTFLHGKFNYIEGSRVASNLKHSCTSCRTHVANAINEKRRKIWDEIPSFFDFDQWDVNQSELDQLLS